MQREKKAVALNSVWAAVGITTLKIVVGFSTGSLGILSEAAHSGLDLVAAAITDTQTNRQAMLHQPERWLSALQQTRHMAGWLADCRFDEGQPMTIRAACLPDCESVTVMT